MRLPSFPVLTIAFLVGAGLSAAANVSLSGTVYDKDNKPLPGVIVSLAKGGMADTTGADGKWILAGTPARIPRDQQIPFARWDGKVLRLSLLSPASVQVESFDASGSRLGALALARLEAGIHSIPLGSARSATGMRWLRLSVDGRSQIIATGSAPRLDQVAVPASLARSAEDTVDQLVYTFQGQLITADTVRTLIQAGLEKWVQEFSVSGKVTADARVSVDSVFAWFDGGRMTGMRRGRLGFNKANSAYSGRIYTVKSLTGDVFNYRLWLNVMGNGNKRTGISDTTDFSSDFGAIDFIPLFTTSNAIPSGSIAGPVAGLVNTDLTFKLALERKDEILAHVEWDLGTGTGFAAGKDSLTRRWLQPGSYRLQARLTDIDSNTSTLTKTVNIINQAAVVAGVRDTTIHTSDIVVFSISATDKDGVAKVLWNFGDGTTDSTFGGPIHSVSHKYPWTYSVDSGSSRVYLLTVTAVDSLGNPSRTSATITVTNDPSRISPIRDTTITPSDVIVYSISATDKDGVAKVLWNFGDGTTDSTFGGPTFIASHKFPGSDSVQEGTSRVFPLVVSVLDSLGHPTVTKVDITVINDIPLVVARDTIGESDSSLSLHAATTDRGQITKVEWSVNGGAFIAGGLDTVIRLPASPTWDYPVLVRVTDEDGNLSDVDTIRVNVAKFITDSRDGQRYRITVIGNQTWMAENVNLKIDSSWVNSMDTLTKGRLYTWATVMSLDDTCNRRSFCAAQVMQKHRGICPTGWHVPSDSEWTILVNAVESDPRVGAGSGGTALKSKSGWTFGFDNGTDLFGFTVHPLGILYPGSTFGSPGKAALFWTASESNPMSGTSAWYRIFGQWESNKGVARDNLLGRGGKFSLRCIQD